MPASPHNSDRSTGEPCGDRPRTSETDLPDGTRENPGSDGEKAGRKFGRVRKLLFRLSLLVATTYFLFFSADFIYFTIVQHRVDQWESNVERNPNGVRVGCESYRLPAAGSPPTSKTDAVLLLVHGINESPDAFARVAPELAKQGFTCEVLRLPGFGESLPAYSRTSWHDWVNAVESKARALKAEFPKVYIVAHSLGAAVSIRATLDSPQNIDGLILAAPAIGVSDQRSPLLPVETWYRLLRRVLLFTQVLESPFGLDTLDPQQRRSKLRTPFTPLPVLDQLFNLLQENLDRAQDLDLPVLMCLADEDKVVSNRAAREFFDALPQADKKLVSLRSGHALLVDYQWKEFCRLTADFVFEMNAKQSRF